MSKRKTKEGETGSRRAKQKNKYRKVAHCYTCEYRIDEQFLDANKTTPDVKGCMLYVNAPISCRRWKDDEITARGVKARIRGK